METAILTTTVILAAVNIWRYIKIKNNKYPSMIAWTMTLVFVGIPQSQAEGMPLLGVASKALLINAAGIACGMGIYALPNL